MDLRILETGRVVSFDLGAQPHIVVKISSQDEPMNVISNHMPTADLQALDAAHHSA